MVYYRLMKHKNTYYVPLPKHGWIVVDAGLKIKISPIAYRNDLPAVAEVERVGKTRVVPGEGLYGGMPSYQKGFKFVD